MKTPKSSTSYKLLMSLLAQKWQQILTDSHQIWHIPSCSESKIKGFEQQFYFLNGSLRRYIECNIIELKMLVLSMLR